MQAQEATLHIYRHGDAPWPDLLIVAHTAQVSGRAGTFELRVISPHRLLLRG
jgi:hypothetical protein